MNFDTAVALIRAHDSWRSLTDSLAAGCDEPPDGGERSGGGDRGRNGTAGGGHGETTYRKLAKLIHPDAAGARRTATATEAFAKLSRLYAGREGAGREGAGREGAGREGAGREGAGREVLSGALADLTRIGPTIRKVPREPRDNDLMAAEATALTRLRQDGDPKYRPYAPKLIGSFVHEDAGRRRRVVNDLEFLDGFVPLTGRKLDWRDAAWMWRRLLVALGWAHRAGVVHGAVFEEHVLIHPGEHGLALVDWCYASPRPQALIKGKHYPPEVTKNRENLPATDIYLATALMRRLIGAGMPTPLKRFADGCMFDAPRMRPQDAWRLLRELDEILGPRTFRPFSL